MENEHPSHLTQQLLISFIHSLHRVFKIGNYYPAGHKVVDQAAENFSIQLKKVAETDRTVTISIGKTHISVENIEVEPQSKAKDEITTILYGTGISSIQLDREISIREMLVLVQKLLSHKARLKSARQFTQSVLLDLPASVKIKARKFLVDKSSIIDENIKGDSSEDMDELFLTLKQQGLTTAQVEQCKNLLYSLSKNYTPTKQYNTKQPDFTWNDVQNLLVKVVKNTFNPEKDSPESLKYQDINALSSVLTHLANDSDDEKAKDSVNMLLSLIKSKDSGSTASPVKQKPKLAKTEIAPAIPLDKLQRYVNQTKLPLNQLKELHIHDRCEEISILLQLLQHELIIAATNKSKLFLRDILSTPLSENEFKVLLAEVKNYLDFKDHSEEILAAIVLQIRQSKHISSLNFLFELGKKLSPSEYLLIWPIIVNELLAVGLNREPKIFISLSEQAGSLTPKEMLSHKNILTKLDVFQAKFTAPNFFIPSLKVSFLLFSFLLTTPIRDLLLPKITILLQNTPPDWIGEAILPFIQPETEEHSRFIQVYLANTGTKGEPPLIIKQLAAEIIAKQLPVLTNEQKEEEWVSTTINACRRLPIDNTKEILLTIASEKKLLLIHNWPADCRKTARSVIKELKIEGGF